MYVHYLTASGHQRNRASGLAALAVGWSIRQMAGSDVHRLRVMDVWLFGPMYEDIK